MTRQGNLSNPDKLGTEERLLEAAGEIFAEHGYRAATVRQICDKAKANLAAVNYYFRDKDGLYLAVMRYLHITATDLYPPSRGLKRGAGPEERLRAFILSLLNRLLGDGRPSWQMKLAARELIDPTPALDVIVEEAIRPLSQELESIVRELLGPETGAESVRLSMLSVVSQCSFYNNSRAVISRLYPEQTFSSQDIENLADHITRFSLAGLRSQSMRLTKNNSKARSEQTHEMK
ncbi:MAG: CerR family C-terminal domain-containing protein [Deltaproteobacteria bacterium]|nr:CerR family C-terminal domain-containing protein [Deltaproteobacteria bacterium]